MELFFRSKKKHLRIKVIFRYLGERGQIADLDRRVRLRARRDYQKAPQSVAQPLRNATDSPPQPVRTNPSGYSTLDLRGGSRIEPGQQTVDSLQLTLGQA